MTLFVVIVNVFLELFPIGLFVFLVDILFKLIPIDLLVKVFDGVKKILFQNSLFPPRVVVNRTSNWVV